MNPAVKSKYSLRPAIASYQSSRPSDQSDENTYNVENKSKKSDGKHVAKDANNGTSSSSNSSHHNNSALTIAFLRKKIQDKFDGRNHLNSLVWAEQLHYLSNELDDQRLYCLALFYIGKYQLALDKASALLGFHKDVRLLIFVVQCFMELKRHQDAFNCMNANKSWLAYDTNLDHAKSKSSDMAQLYTLYGLLAYHLGFDERARSAFVKAIHYDIFEVNAFEYLNQYHLLDTKEEIKLIRDIHFKSAGSMSFFLQSLYLSRLNKINSESFVLDALERLKKEYQLHSSPLLRLQCAEVHYYRYQYDEAYKICTALRECEPHDLAHVPLFISLCYELGKAKEIFVLAHFLMDHYPSNALTWVCIGTFYLLKKNYEEARKFFCKATTVNANQSEAWIGFGHVFSCMGEHEQAISAYTNASTLLRTSPYPLLYIATEYLSLKNYHLAGEFLSQALGVSPLNMMVLNESGLLSYRLKRYDSALAFSQKAVEIAEQRSIYSSCLSSIYYNHALVLIKLNRTEEAAALLRKSDSMTPACQKILLSLGWAYHASRNFEVAIEYYHQCLRVKSNSIAATLVDMALKQNGIEIDFSL